jgi:hypothetical protein
MAPILFFHPLRPQAVAAAILETLLAQTVAVLAAVLEITIRL